MPGFVYIFGSAVPLILYGIQHYFSMIGSLVLIPLVIVPAMDGNSVSLHSSDAAMFVVVALQCRRSLFPC
jgi:nucleobase transporter 1/2